MAAPTDPRRPLPWYRVPVVWLGVLVFAASIAGCVWITAMGARYPDQPVPGAAHAVLGVPVRAHPAPASP